MALELTSEWPGFTAEGYRIYENAVQQIRTALASGYTYDQACAGLCHLTAGAREFITTDFLKILLAEEHLGNGIAMDDLSLTLGLPSERLELALTSLLGELEKAATVALLPMVSTLTH